MATLTSLDQLLGSALADHLRAVVTACLTMSSDAATEAFKANRHSDGFTYGTNRWRFGLAELADGVEGLPTGRAVKVGHLRLGVIGGQARVLIYPVAVGTTAKLDTSGLHLRQSAFRQALFAGGSPADQLELDFGTSDLRRETIVADPTEAADWDDDCLLDAEQEDDAAPAADLARVLPDRQVLLLTYTSNPLNGLMSAVVGQARMASDGTVTYLWFEHLDITDGGSGNGGRGLVIAGGPTSPGPSFTSGALPELEMPPRRREREAAVGGEPMPDAQDTPKPPDQG
jgi:hypothetical protein